MDDVGLGWLKVYSFLFSHCLFPPRIIAILYICASCFWPYHSILLSDRIGMKRLTSTRNELRVGVAGT